MRTVSRNKEAAPIVPVFGDQNKSQRGQDNNHGQTNNHRQIEFTASFENREQDVQNDQQSKGRYPKTRA